ncbi:MAG: hypothetical protein HUJ25_00735 [Crocinitomicaceae bacterium]|nr:hypothetical protein [Crocinitomicaceae bacterium]
MNKIALLLISLFTLNFANAQFEFDPGSFIDKLIGPVESDRPGQALNPVTAGILAVQLQTGFSYSSKNDDKLYKYQHYYVPTNLRFGLTRKWEFNTSFYYLNQQMMDTVATTKTSGFLSPEVGIRYAFMSGDRWKPYLALQSNLSFLSHKGDFQQQQYGCSFILATSNRFDIMSINTNFGIRFTGDASRQPTYPWVLNFGWMLGDKVGTFIEGFGEFRNMNLNVDGGFSYVPIRSLQLDVFGGLLNIEDEYNRWFAEIGVTYNFSFLKVLANKKAKEMMNKM